MKLYFGMNVYNKVFDDQTQLKIRLESIAVDILFELIEKRNYELVWSFILDYENSKNPFSERNLYIQLIFALCSEIIEPNDEIKLKAKSIVEGSNAKFRDALHLAAAIYGDCDYYNL